jgi:hypothetical protein
LMRAVTSTIVLAHLQMELDSKTLAK